jgi:glycosyltransferase involved in cell wall biosynthesis
MSERQISVSIPTYNRTEMTVCSFEDVYEDSRISEVVIVDDCSDLGLFTHLKAMCNCFPKVRLFRNKVNRDCYGNKATALVYSKNDWCVLFDSDNKLQQDYIEKIFSIEKWEDDTIYTPDFAYPNFDFRNYSGLVITKENVANYIEMPMFETMLNACNYFVNKDKYLEVWNEDADPVTSDSIYMIYRWLEAGNKLQVVSGLSYFHRVHDGSHYRNNKARTPDGFHEAILNKLKSMS